VLKPIPGYEGLYSVTADGRVWSHPKRLTQGFRGRVHSGMWLKASIYKNGYSGFVLCKGSVRTRLSGHRLVALAWIPNPLGLPQVNHLDGVRDHNTVDNLEWCTHSQNAQHAYRAGLVGLPIKNTGARRYYSGD
jgi:hypothetical protein